MIWHGCLECQMRRSFAPNAASNMVWVSDRGLPDCLFFSSSAVGLQSCVSSTDAVISNSPLQSAVAPMMTSVLDFPCNRGKKC